eukprot:CAMPEP_0176496030 /NCGR_PEP_ID=MMETSP0200_2-20121128/10982_1 /TAXON_ID=947934 /ORGANISM="Chaetoceros sp., Strain GSL56" /LENGTH=433 /DNA_ID=CAMNT_0017893967 /DNA_START=426 /DNA_END=1727 /DNA_ORIENTATION=-
MSSTSLVPPSPSPLPLPSSSSLARDDSDDAAVLKLAQELSAAINVHDLENNYNDHVNVNNIDGDGDDDDDDDCAASTSSPSFVLTKELLKVHNKTFAQEASSTNLNSSDQHGGGGMERRQFNCPECPKRGRGKFVFFKNVPAYKPIVKCPQCKKASGGGGKSKGRGAGGVGGGGGGTITRLYALPKVCEKGYGLFKCMECQETWGSSRAIGHIGQECYNCKTKSGKIVYVKPFRLEVVKKNKGGILGGGPGLMRMRRVPKQSIGEMEATHVGYTDDDRERNQNNAANVLVTASKSGERKQGGDGGGGNGNAWERASMFIFLPPTPPTSSKDEQLESGAPNNIQKTQPLMTIQKVGVPPGYSHHCEGCASGLCKSRYLPKSLYHDESDGDTVSTRASVVTNSSIDKTDYVDRDEDFSFYEDVSEGWETVPRRRR